MDIRRGKNIKMYIFVKIRDPYLLQHLVLIIAIAHLFNKCEIRISVCHLLSFAKKESMSKISSNSVEWFSRKRCTNRRTDNRTHTDEFIGPVGLQPATKNKIPATNHFSYLS